MMPSLRAISALIILPFFVIIFLVTRYTNYNHITPVMKADPQTTGRLLMGQHSSIKDDAKINHSEEDKGLNQSQYYHTLSETGIGLDYLVNTLNEKLNVIQMKESALKPTCASKETIANSCQGADKCLRMKMPRDIETRLSQLISPKELQIKEQYQKVLEEMRQKVKGSYDVILVTASSSNHYFEAQAMIKNVHERILPNYKNFTFLFYNLGLSAKELRSMKKYCKCQVLDFPFEKFPNFMRSLTCYSWKPVIIKAHAQQTNILLWADASIRFKDDANELKGVIERTRERGIQMPSTPGISPFRTFRRMYHYFGDEPCMYLDMWQAVATFGAYGREPFVDRAILEPWVACALNKECICTGDNNKPPTPSLPCARSNNMAKQRLLNKGPIVYGLCNRYDQAAISIILHKLYQNYYHWVMYENIIHVDIRRDDKLHYFPN